MFQTIKNFNIKEFFNKYGIFLLIFCLAFLLRVGAILQKTTMFWDDPISIAISTPNNLSFEGQKFKQDWKTYNLIKGKEYKAIDLKKALFATSNSPRSILKDIYSITFHNMDQQHTNFYYSLLRIWNSGISGINNKEIINRGCSLNLIFFTLSFFFMYKLLALIKDEKKFISIGLFFSFLSTGVISNTLMIRCYALMEPLFILATYVFLKLYKNITETKEDTNLKIKDYILISVIMALTLNSAYISLFYVFLLWISLFIAGLYCKKYNMLKNISLIIPVTLLFLLIVNPCFFKLFLSPRYTITTNQLSILYLINIKTHLAIFADLITKFSLYDIILFVPLFIITIYNKQIIEEDTLGRKEKTIIQLLIWISLIWMYIAIKLNDLLFEDEKIRFLFPALPIFNLVFILLTYNLKKWILGIIAILYLIGTIYSVKGLYIYPIQGKIMDVHFNLFEQVFYPQYKNTPVIMFDNPNLFANYISTMDDNQIVILENKLPGNNYKYNDFGIISTHTLPLNRKIFFFDNTVIPGLDMYYHVIKKSALKNYKI